MLHGNISPSLLLLTLAGVACQTDTAVLAERTVTTIGVEGGAAISADGALTLNIPSGALSATTEIVIQTVRGHAEPRLRSLVYDFGPDGQQFATPVEIEIRGVGTSEEVAIALMDGASPEVLESSVRGGDVLRASTTHFSSYGVVTVYNPCAAKSCGDSCTICDPTDASCVEPAPASKACNRTGLCVDAILACSPVDAGVVDSGVSLDVGPGVDLGGLDAGTADLGPVDTGVDAGSAMDLGPADLGPGVCSETFTQNPQPIADVLVVADTSGSMHEELATLASSFGLLESTLNSNNVDFHLGVAHFDVPTYGGLLQGGSGHHHLEHRDRRGDILCDHRQSPGLRRCARARTGRSRGGVDLESRVLATERGPHDHHRHRRTGAIHPNVDPKLCGGFRGRGGGGEGPSQCHHGRREWM